MRGDDDTMSQFSRNSGAESRGKKLRITRTVKNKYDEYEEIVETVTDSEVIRLYLKRKKQERLMNMKLDDIKPTGDDEYDRQQIIKLKAEFARLARNIERREGREKAKGIFPKDKEGGTTAGPGKGGATPRKCANCGEVGHIKTNKKLCPLLNGQKKQSDTFRDASAASPAAVAPMPSFAGSPS
jgi:transcription initiation factor TFIID subunit 1